MFYPFGGICYITMIVNYDIVVELLFFDLSSVLYWVVGPFGTVGLPFCATTWSERFQNSPMHMVAPKSIEKYRNEICHY